MSPPDVVSLEEIGEAQRSLVGGKGARLGELARINGVRVPAGFCVTTDAFRQVMAEVAQIGDPLEKVSRLDPEDRDSVRALCSEIRGILEAAAIPRDLEAAIGAAVAACGEQAAYAVRSSATAEDSPWASFAGQHDTYLDVVGTPAILAHVRRCWASLFTERAVIYRLRHHVDHRKVQMAVVVQLMVFAEAAGVLFTADPITANRTITSIEATWGLGEALVAGLVNPDIYKVRDDRVISKEVAAHPRGVSGAPGGGTPQRVIASGRQERPVLSDAQAVKLARIGRLIEAHFGQPQDVEWCLADGELQIVQSRPITTLFPIPPAPDGGHHLYVSVGHQQMMTDAMKPLGLSIWQLTAGRPMAEAGGRLFVDVTKALASPASRASLIEMLGRSDPLIGDALQTACDRGDVIEELPGEEPEMERIARGLAPPFLEADPAIVEELIALCRASLETTTRAMQTKSGVALLDFIEADVRKLKDLLLGPRSLQVILAAMGASWWLNEHLEEWLGEKNAADVLTRSIPDDVTSQMGLALLDVADVIRPHPDVVHFLEQSQSDAFLDELANLEGGREARDAISGYLDAYGMRCVGEIDITRPRWRERPSMLVPVILSNVKSFEQGAGRRRFEQGRKRAWEKEREVLGRLHALADGERKAVETKAMIDRVRTFMGYREYPKYHMVSRYFLYKQALLQEADRLVGAGVLDDREDVFYLRFDELREVVRTHQMDDQLIGRRKEAFRSYQALRPPRVLTSDGEVVVGSYGRSDVPAGALVGLPVSTGTVEGRARVVLDMGGANLEAGDILVTTYTDPSWTPVFVIASALVTEVGGLMTHGAVVAREYGLPAVVGVENATRLIRDGQQIRVHGTEGYVEILA